MEQIWFSFFFKGDLILQCDYLFEALTKLSVIANKQKSIQVVQGRYTHCICHESKSQIKI